MKKIVLLVLTMTLVFSCKLESKKEAITVNYPTTAKVDTIDIYFGTQVKDPYR